MASSDLARRLRAVSLFGQFDESEAAALGVLLAEEECPAGAAVFAQGEPGDALYVIDSGQVQVVHLPAGAAEQVLASLGAGEVLGEMSLLTDEPRSATARATQPTRLLKISRSAFLGAVGRGETWATKLLLKIGETLAGRIHRMNRELLTLIHEHQPQAAGPRRVAELEQLKQRLFTEWSF